MKNVKCTLYANKTKQNKRAGGNLSSLVSWLRLSPCQRQDSVPPSHLALSAHRLCKNLLPSFPMVSQLTRSTSQYPHLPALCSLLSTVSETQFIPLLSPRTASSCGVNTPPLIPGPAHLPFPLLGKLFPSNVQIATLFITID